MTSIAEGIRLGEQRSDPALALLSEEVDHLIRVFLKALQKEQTVAEAAFDILAEIVKLGKLDVRIGQFLVDPMTLTTDLHSEWTQFKRERVETIRRAA